MAPQREAGRPQRKDEGGRESVGDPERGVGSVESITNDKVAPLLIGGEGEGSGFEKQISP